MIVVLDALQALECTGCEALIEIDRAVSEDAELRMRWMDCVRLQHAACDRAKKKEMPRYVRKKLHRYRPMRGQI